MFPRRVAEVIRGWLTGGRRSHVPRRRRVGRGPRCIDRSEEPYIGRGDRGTLAVEAIGLVVGAIALVQLADVRSAVGDLNIEIGPVGSSGTPPAGHCAVSYST